MNDEEIIEEVRMHNLADGGVSGLFEFNDVEICMQKARADILGNRTTCIFKTRFKYDPCRSCTHDHQYFCDNYLAEVSHEKPHKERLPRDYQDWIRKANDSGVVA